MEGGVETGGTAWVMAGMASSFFSTSAVEAAIFSLLLGYIFILLCTDNGYNLEDSEVETATVIGACIATEGVVGLGMSSACEKVAVVRGAERLIVNIGNPESSSSHVMQSCTFDGFTLEGTEL